MIKTLMHKKIIRPNRLIFYIAIVTLYLALTSFTSIVYSQDYITPENAGEHIRETQTVCGTVASTNYAIRSKDQPTFLNLNQPYPNHIFTVVIWGEYRAKFNNPPETFYKGKGICVKGMITEYRGKPQIEVKEPLQIKIK